MAEELIPAEAAKSVTTPAAKPKAKLAKPVIAPAVVKAAAPVEVPKTVSVKALVPVKVKAVVKPAPKKLVKAPKPASAIKKIAAAPKPKGSIAMPTTSTISEKAKTMFTEINDRAKAALEKGSKVGGELTEFTKGNVEAIVASAKTAAKGAETLGQEMADYGKKSFETASSTMKSMTMAKTPTELFQLQSDYAKSSFDSAVTEMSKLSEAWLKLAGDVFQPLSSRYALAAEKFKATA
jgi:phasin family protein